MHTESHKVHRIAWLRAAVLGANDGIVSTASLILGVAGAGASLKAMVVAGVAGLVAGAMSMAAGEYVSVSSQADTEKADLEQERLELMNNPKHELIELTNIYIGRGLNSELAKQVAEQLTAHDALGAHCRDELGITDIHAARPLVAAWTSAFCFAAGALFPLLILMLFPFTHVQWWVSVGSTMCLAVLGGLSAYVGGAPWQLATVRVTFWGALAMAVTFLVGGLFGVVA